MGRPVTVVRKRESEMFVFFSFPELHIIHKEGRMYVGISFLEMIIERVLIALKMTSQSSAHLFLV